MKFCGVIFIGGGSTHAYADSPLQAAQKAAKLCKQDWGKVMTFERHHKFQVCVFKMEHHEGWYAEFNILRDDKTHEIIPMQEVIQVTV